jgi:RsiW-degrading membrane proteinase PrsW (M82 family)
MLVGMVLYATLALCAVLASVMVYRYDLHDREPWYMLVLATVMGAITMFSAGKLQVWAMALGGTAVVHDWNTWMALAAGITEEFAKLAVVVTIAAVLPRMFNDPMDGIIYGSFAGLGAALEESIALLGPSVQMWDYLPAQEPVRLLGHLVMGGVGGFAVGMIRPVRRKRWLIAFAFTWGFAVAIHVFWDIVAFSAGDLGRMLLWHKAAAVGLMLGGLAVYWRLVAVAEGVAREWFRGDAAAVSS